MSEVHVLVPGGAPEFFDENVVDPAHPAAHADAHVLHLERISQRLAEALVVFAIPGFLYRYSASSSASAQKSVANVLDSLNLSTLRLKMSTLPSGT
jgi:hypothetical protein